MSEKDALIAAMRLRLKARTESCKECGSIYRNNVECPACRAYLRNRGLSNLLETVMTSRLVQP